MKIILCLGVAVLAALLAESSGLAGNPKGVAISLEEAFERALEYSPHLKAAEGGIGVAEANVQQARLVPNPELEWEGEEIAGSRPLISEAEHTLVLSQTIELGGKRSARTQRAESEIELAQAKLESLRLDLKANVASSYLEVSVAQKALALFGESIRLADSLSNATQLRVDAGAAATVEALRSRVAVTHIRLDSTRAASDWRSAKKSLASLWGLTEPDFEFVTGTLPPLTPVPRDGDLLALSETVPQLRVRRIEIEASRRDLAVAKSLGTPDLSIAAGPRFTTENGSKSFVLGVSLPLPLFNRNQGAIASATQTITVAELEHEAALVEWKSNVVSTLTAMEAAYNEAMTITDTMIPQASTVFQEIDRGYREGRFTYLELLTAEQDLINARERLLDVDSEYHHHRIEVERLIGRSLQELEESDAQ